MQQKTLGKPISLKGYYDGIECSANDYDDDEPTLLDELEQAVGHELIAPIIIEDDENPCPADCVVILGLEQEDNECPHCSYESLKMRYTPPYQRK